MRSSDLPIPYGWYAVSYSDELAVGEVKPLYFFGRDLVLFRTESGQAVLLDAFCPHLGAHLGHGGEVHGESIACPFHGWQFNGAGMCTSVPYANNMPSRVKDKPCIQGYPVTEVNRTIFAWYHPRNVAPLFEVDVVPQLNEQRRIEGIPTDETWDAWSGRIVLNWQFADDAMAYVKYSRGYKPGGFNPGTTVNNFRFRRANETALTYEREDVDAFEIGSKALLFDGSLSLGVAAFYNDYRDLQLAETDLELLSGAAVNTNVDAEMYGAELELRWRPVFAPRAEFEVAYAWLDTKVKNEPARFDPKNPTNGDPNLVLLSDWQTSYTPYVARIEDVLPLVPVATGTPFPWAWGADRAPAAQYANGIPAWFDRNFLEFFGVDTLDGVPIAISGNRLPETPEHSIHLAASYTWDVTIGSLTARWDYYWQDDAYMTIFNRPSHRIDSWDQHNASLVLESLDGRWSVRAWVKNIDDDVHITGGMRSNGPYFSVSEPRTWGASVRYNFGVL